MTTKERAAHLTECVWTLSRREDVQSVVEAELKQMLMDYVSAIRKSANNDRNNYPLQYKAGKLDAAALLMFNEEVP